MDNNKGFTLLELMVAMMIFAMLAMLGWQTFDGLNKAHNRSRYHADNLSQLQYAYLQVHNDMNQIVAWSADIPTEKEAVQSQMPPDSEAVTPNFVQLTSNSMSFIRFADPDPRYQSTSTLVKIEYAFDNSQFIRRQHDSIRDDSQAIQGMESVLLTKVQDFRLQALLPEQSDTFASRDNNPINISNNSNAQENDQPPQNLVPKGISIQLTHQQQPVNWRFALVNTAPIVKTDSDNKY